MTGSAAAPISSGVVAEPPEQRRTLAVLLSAQILSGAGLAAGITVGALLAEQMLGSSRLSGLPTVFFTIGSAAAAVGLGRVSQRFGRRTGLSAGYLTGALGCLGAVIAAAVGSITLLFASMLVYGAGAATNLQARYAGADLAAPSRRGRAVSIVLVATAVGAILGPNLVRATGTVAAKIGFPALAGPFMLGALAYVSGALVLWLLLRPDPLLLARRLAADASSQATPETATEQSVSAAAAKSRQKWSWPLASGAGIMIITQLIMVAIMTITPIHIEHHGHGIGVTGIVIGAHVAGMFLPSPFSGWLVDRFGYLAIAVAAGVTLLAAGLIAAWTPVDSVAMLVLALVLLGVGWNLGLVSGTTLVTDAVPLATRARTQGMVDLGIALAGAGGGLSSGLIFAATSYATLTLTGGLLALLIIPIVAVGRPAAIKRA